MVPEECENIQNEQRRQILGRCEKIQHRFLNTTFLKTASHSLSVTQIIPPIFERKMTWILGVPLVMGFLLDVKTENKSVTPSLNNAQSHQGYSASDNKLPFGKQSKQRKEVVQGKRTNPDQDIPPMVGSARN